MVRKPFSARNDADQPEGLHTDEQRRGERMTSVAGSVDASRTSLTIGGLFVLGLGALDFGLEQSVIVPALPHLARAYGASLIAVGWLVTAYLLVGVVAAPLLARMGDLHGKRRMLLVSVGGCVVGSLMCAVTDSIGVAIVGRGVQGIAAAIAPLTFGLVRDATDPQRISRTIGALVGIATVGGGIGYLLGGLLVDAFSPTSIFWFLFGFGAVVFVGVALVVEESPWRTAGSLDLTGALLLGVGLVALLLALSKGSDWAWSSATIRFLFVVSAVALTAFAAVERRVNAPLVDLQLVVRKPFVSTNLCAVTFGFAFFGATYILPLIAATPPRSGYGLGLSTTRIGLLLAATSIASLAAAWGGGRVVDRIGSRLLAVAGACFGLAGYCVLAASHSSTSALAVGTATVAVGAGFIPTAVLSVVLRSARPDEAGVAPAITLLFRSLGLSVGLTVTFAVISGAGLDGLFRNDVGFTRAYLVGAAGAVFALLAALFLPGRRSTFHADAPRSGDREHDPTGQTLSPG